MSSFERNEKIFDDPVIYQPHIFGVFLQYFHLISLPIALVLFSLFHFKIVNRITLGFIFSETNSVGLGL